MPTTLDDCAGQVVEISGRIVGTAPIDSGTVLILDCGGVSLTVDAPSAAPSYWLDAGAIVRCLVRVPNKDQLSDRQSSVDLVASAPEGAVAAADQADAAAAEAATLAAQAAAAADHDRLEKLAEARLKADRATLTNMTSRSARYDTRLGLGHPVAALPQRDLAVYPIYRSAVAKMNSSLPASEVDKITTSILYYSDIEGIDPRLIFAMIIAESGFDPMCTSRTGAMGLGQLMPGTAAGLGVRDAYDPVQNIGAAVHILSGHVRQYGGATPTGIVPVRTLMLTMAAYNAGPGAVKRYGGIPPFRETQRYVRRVAYLYKSLCRGD